VFFRFNPLTRSARYGELAPFCASVKRERPDAEAAPTLPPAAYRLATNIATNIAAEVAQVGEALPPPPRGVYSFCMCPGGQIVPT